MRDLWYKDATIYCLDVETYKDSNGDGIGDFPALTQQLAYIEGLGVNCLWLLPFYPTPNRDNGYDITDYYGVDARLGTLGDFVEFMHQARGRGLRVIIDLVVNHTSDQPIQSLQLYERGICRRLPPMLDGDQRRIRLAYSLSC